MTPRAKKLLAVAAVTAWIVAGVQLWRSLRGPDAEPARERLRALSARWNAARSPPPRTLADTYAVVRAGPSTVAWSELLHAAGAPLAVELTGDAPVPDGARLVVVASTDGLDALRAPGRAVVAVERAGERRNASAMTWGDITVPLDGAGVVALTPAAGETVLATDDAGHPLAAASSRNGSVTLRLGVDLAAVLWRLRLGDPALPLTDRDGNGEVQPADALPRLDPSLTETPFADRVMARLMETLTASLPCALPRLRGLPTGARAVLVITADQDYADDEKLTAMGETLAGRGAHATFLLTEPSVGRRPDLNVRSGAAPTLSLDAADALLAQGHDLGVHPFPAAIDDVAAHVALTSQRLSLPMLFARDHHLRWIGRLDVPRAEAARGVAMNLDYMAVCDGRRPCVGFPGGSSVPVMIADGDDRVPILQQPTAVDDFSLRVNDYAQLAGAATALASAARETLIVARAAEVPVVLNAHPTLYAFAPQWLASVLSTPDLRAMSASEWLSFVLHRRASRVPAARCGARVAATLGEGVALR